ncbi:MAG: hypothetical protein R3303_11645 [Marinobacter sp.]|nr:hypothetical protein [Marinobacter sp.]
MKEAELYGRARQLAEKARTAKYPALMPKVAREAIQEAAALIEELATREAKRWREQQTTENR